MAQAAHGGLVKNVRFVGVATLVIGLFSAGGVVHAACTNCTFFGTNAGSGNTANDVTGFGYDALSSSNSGGGNTATGFQALEDNTSGDDNTATGGALMSNTAGGSNTAVGSAPLVGNTQGGGNTAVGVDAPRE